MLFSPKTLILFGFIWCLCLFQCKAYKEVFSLNNYADNSYPDRCVIDTGGSLVLMSQGDVLPLRNLPCTNILCTGDGIGMLYTCQKEIPPEGCSYGEILHWDAPFPKCCRRKLVCNEN